MSWSTLLVPMMPAGALPSAFMGAGMPCWGFGVAASGSAFLMSFCSAEHGTSVCKGKAGGTSDAHTGSSVKAKTIPSPFPTSSELKCLQNQSLALSSGHYNSTEGSFSRLFYFISSYFP